MKTLQFTLVSLPNTFIGRINGESGPAGTTPSRSRRLRTPAGRKGQRGRGRVRREADLHGPVLCVLWALMQFDTSFKYLHCTNAVRIMPWGGFFSLSFTPEQIRRES